MLTLKEFLYEKHAVSDSARLIFALTGAVKEIAAVISRGAGMEGKIGSVNVSGDEQIALDVQANTIISRCLEQSGVTGLYYSEELEDEVRVKEAGPLAVAFDPLDGSSIVDVNMAVGSIFGFYEADNFIGVKGNEQVGAMIAVYGPATTIVFTLRNGVHEAVLKDGEFVMGRQSMVIQNDGKYFAPGNLQAIPTEKNYLKLTGFWMENGYKLRYSGGMVPDINHILVKGGGIFTYPGYVKAPQGKLRLLYECAPMALIMEEAGGSAYANREQKILDIPVEILSRRTPIFIGSKNEVEKALEIVFG